MKFALTGFCVLSFFVVRSQEATDIADVLAKETCDCINKKTNGVFDDMEKVTADLGVCIMESYFNHEEEASKKFGIEEFNEQAGEVIGQQVGVKMLKHCPDVIIKIGGASEEDGAVAEEESNHVEVKGKVLAVEEGEFVAFKIKDASNIVHRIVWLTKFEGGEQYEKNPKALVGKNVTVTAYELEFFNAKTKTYVPVKQIMALTID